MCPVCASEPEDTYHAFFRCPRAVGLWQAMASDWRLPDVRKLVNPGPEWLLHILGDSTETERLHLLMTLWRSWHVRNDIVHHKRPPTVESSKRFLHSYVNSLVAIQAEPHADHVKGKTVVGADLISRSSSHVIQPKDLLRRWLPPPAGWTSLNVDGSFCEHDHSAGAGMILRGSDGNPIFAACRQLRTCASLL